MDRVMEVESDIHEQLQDADGYRHRYARAAELWRCLLTGILDDLDWRANDASGGHSLGFLVAASAAFGGSIWLASTCLFLALGAVYLAVPAAVLGAVASLVLFGIVDDDDTEEDTMTHVGDSRLKLRLGVLAAILLPLVLLATVVLVPSTNNPQSDYTAVAGRVADSPGRWQAGYLLYSLALGLWVVVMFAVSDWLRASGVRLIGGLLPVMFTLCAALIIAAGQGATGLGAGIAIDADLDGEQYLRFASDETVIGLVSAVGAALVGLALITTAVVIWHRRLLSGVLRVTSIVGFALLGLLFGLTSGWAVQPAAAALPLAAALAFWPIAVRLWGAPASIVDDRREPASQGTTHLGSI
jgi:hypothetical protein